MTIRSHIDAAALNRQYGYFERCAEVAPEGTFNSAKAARTVIGRHLDEMIGEFRALGFPVSNSDGAREVEAVIYGWVRESQTGEAHAAEGFGEHVDGPAGERIMARLISDRDFLRS